MTQNRSITIQGNKLQFLEALRGLAALYVVIHHARWLLWAGYSNAYLKNPEQFNIFNKILVYFFSIFIYGHQMVIFFFILSGFVIHLRYSRNLVNNNSIFNFKDYFLRRFKRIFPPLLFALLLTFVLDSIGKHNNYTIYGPDTPFKIVKDNFDLSTLFGNLALLMNTYVETWGSNFALWSLKFEWWFYMLFPLLFIVLKRSSLFAFFLLLLLYLASFLPQYWPFKLLNEIFGYMIIWWFGVILADMYCYRIKISFKQLIPLALVIPILVVLRLNLSQQINDTLWGLGFMGVLAIFLYLNERAALPGFLNKLEVLGKFSYSLYVTHVPILVLISGYLLNKGNGLPLGFGFVFAGIFVCVLFAYCVHFIIEVPFLSKKTNTKTLS